MKDWRAQAKRWHMAQNLVVHTSQQSSRGDFLIENSTRWLLGLGQTSKEDCALICLLNRFVAEARVETANVGTFFIIPAGRTKRVQVVSELHRRRCGEEVGVEGMKLTFAFPEVLGRD
jgi:hypothetical protein